MALDSAMALWGCIFYARSSQEPLPHAVYPQLLLCVCIASNHLIRLTHCRRNRTLSELGQSLTNASAQHIIQVIQAHTLLAVYLCDTCSYLESRVHIDAAAALALHVGLHKIHGTSGNVPYGSFLDPITIVLPEPLDTVEEGERTSAFWASFCLDRIYAVVLGAPPVILDTEDADMRIDTPWPLDMILYEQVRGMASAFLKANS